MEALIELLQKTIEQKGGQIEELRGTIMQLQATIANLNETIEEFRRKFFGSSSEKTTGRMIRHRKRQRPEKQRSAAIPGNADPSPGGRTFMPICRSGKSAVPSRKKTGSALIALHRWKPWPGPLSAKNCGLLPQRWNGSATCRTTKMSPQAWRR